jgi:hypothetical protein
MPPPKLYRVKKVIGFDQAMLDSVEQWQAKQEQIPTVAEAVRRLVALGLGRAKPVAQISSKASSGSLLLDHLRPNFLISQRNAEPPSIRP